MGLLLEGCGGTSSKCKKIYNENISFAQKDADVLKSLIESDGEKMGQNFGTSFFHLSADEQKTCDSCEFDDEMMKNSTLANAVSIDAKDLSDLYSQVISVVASKEDKEKASKKTFEINWKYFRFLHIRRI